MKITGYRLLHTTQEWGRAIGDVNGVVEAGVTEVPLVVVTTDVGLEGVGFGHHDGIPAVFEVLDGEDPRAVSSLYDRMLARAFKSGHGGATFGGIGALDGALWDLKAQALGEPLWRLLGGRDRFVPGYASGLDFGLDDAGLLAFYGEMADRGFTAAKLKGGLDVGDDRDRLTLVRDLLGRGSRSPLVMLDANESWNLKQAVRYLAELEKHVELAWIEEPLRRWDGQGLARLRAAVTTAVATGENLSGLEQYRYLLDFDGVDIVQTAAVWGVTHTLRVAQVAHFRDLPLSLVGVASNYAVVHAATALPNHLSTEVPTLVAPVGVELDLTVQDGGIVLGDQPGCGVRIDESALTGPPAVAWGGQAGPHVRSSRAGLELGLRDATRQRAV